MGLNEQRRFIEDALEPFVADVRRTFDPNFDVVLSVEDEMWEWSAYNSAATISGTSWDPSESPSDGLAILTVQLADQIPEWAFDEETFIGLEWPRCPIHGDHPLYAQTRGYKAVWACKRAGGGAVCEIGHFGE